MDTNIAPPLDIDLASVDTSMPLLVETIYDLRIDTAEIKKTNDGKGEIVNLVLVTTAPATSKVGEPLNPGVKVFDRAMTTPVGKATWAMVTQNLGAITQAAKLPPGVARLNNIPEWVPQLVGRTVRCKVGYEPEGSKNGKSYKAKNTIAAYLKS